MNIFRAIAEEFGWIRPLNVPEVGSLWVEKKPMFYDKFPTVFRVERIGEKWVDCDIVRHPSNPPEDGLPDLASPGFYRTITEFNRLYKPLEIQPTQPWPRS